jgi:hypothetical protein
VGERSPHTREVVGSTPTPPTRYVAPSSSGLGRSPLKAEIAGSNPAGATKLTQFELVSERMDAKRSRYSVRLISRSPTQMPAKTATRWRGGRPRRRGAAEAAAASRPRPHQLLLPRSTAPNSCDPRNVPETFAPTNALVTFPPSESVCMPAVTGMTPKNDKS